MAEYDLLPPNGTLRPSRFKVFIPEEQLNEMKQLISLSKLGPKTFENQQEDLFYGVSYRWLSDAKSYWEKRFNWRTCEAHINSFANFEASIDDDNGAKYAIHFTGVFSQNPEAIPVLLLHGWPGSFMEFLKILNRVRGMYSPEDLPYHFVVPSLPGYAFSTGPPTLYPWSVEDSARILHKLMIGLGFTDGYVAHGGDIGSFIARIMAVSYVECKAMHLNFCIMRDPPENIPDNAVSQEELVGLERAADFFEFGSAYAKEHGQRPSTIGFVLSSNPLALLAWIGEKFLSWTDTDPSIEDILESVTLYWLTSTFPRAMYPYIQIHGDNNLDSPVHGNPRLHCMKPFGYSYFPKEIGPMPVSWVSTTGNLIWSRSHGEGGHFAAMEKPELLLKDLEDFLAELT